eukprot:2096636-Alexandrium_andersonii.AAC.1
MCIRDSAKLASGFRTWNCAGPEAASNLVPEAPEGWIFRARGLKCSRWSNGGPTGWSNRVVQQG